MLVRGSREHARQRQARLPTGQRAPRRGSAAAMLVRGASHLSSLTLSRGTLEAVPLLTWSCFPAALRVALKDTKRTEKGARYCLQQLREHLEVGDGELDRGLFRPSSWVSPPRGVSRPLSAPSAPPPCSPAPRCGPAPRSRLAAPARNRLVAPPRESSSRGPQPAARPARWVGAGPPLPAGGGDAATLARRH